MNQRTRSACILQQGVSEATWSHHNGHTQPQRASSAFQIHGHTLDHGSCGCGGAVPERHVRILPGVSRSDTRQAHITRARTRQLPEEAAKARGIGKPHRRDHMWGYGNRLAASPQDTFRRGVDRWWCAGLLGDGWAAALRSMIRCALKSGASQEQEHPTLFMHQSTDISSNPHHTHNTEITKGASAPGAGWSGEPSSNPDRSGQRITSRPLRQA